MTTRPAPQGVADPASRPARVLSTGALYLGLDLGTSGARAVVIDGAGQERATARSAMAEHGPDHRDPGVWRAAAFAVLKAVLAQVDPAQVRSIAVDGTSGTMLGLDGRGRPVSQGIMYNDPCTDAGILGAIASHAPATSAAHGPTSGAARVMVLARSNPARVLHQADWISFLLSGRMVSDANNALKTGYDPVQARWPQWMEQAGIPMALLPPVLEPGRVIGPVTAECIAALGLSADCVVVAGTTDGCASFLATGASMPGDGVTALGTTLTVKLLTEQPIFAPDYGIYSHRILGQWLAGGASNSGGAALLAHFTPVQMAHLSPLIDTETDTGLDFYPLPGRGERFPVADPAMPSRTLPRPADDVHFLQALFEGVARIEALAYRRLAELGAAPLGRLRSVGGGAANPVWTRLRAQRLRVPMLPPLSTEAAFGAALLARRGAGA
jgi:sugar (pentulose or hexulose) kinase